MKIKNLLLAGLVVAAMTACSNSEEFVDNSIQPPTGEQANMRISFSTSAITRASNVTDGGKDEGTKAESSITTATIVLDYGDSKRIVKDNLTLNGTPDADKVLIASTPKFEVASGSNVKITVFINPSEALNAAIASNTGSLENLLIGDQVLPLNTFLTAGIAKTENFLMSGVKTGVKILAGVDTNEETIEVNRVCAKLEEKTDDTKFNLSGPTVNVDGNKETLAVVIIGHSYSNLIKNSYVLSQASSWKGESPYLQTYPTEGYDWITNSITYCLENKVGGSWATAKSSATNVQYKGQVYYMVDDVATPAETFYVKSYYNNDNKEVKTVYKTWADMKEDFSGLSETEGDAEYLKNNGIVKYTDGICYYEAPIQHVDAGCTIVRNNWYQLTVTTIADLGWPGEVPPPTTDPTKLTVKANIMPWTIHKNNIKL